MLGDTRWGPTLPAATSPDRPEVLRDALLNHVREHAEAVARSVRTPYGVKYVLVGPMACPDGRSPQVRSVWQIDRGNWRPRCVTAYPE